MEVKVTFAVVHELSPSLESLLHAGITVLAETLTRMESMMANKFDDLMQEIRSATQEIKANQTGKDAAEVQEDADAAARDQANADKIAELQAQIDSGTLSAAQKAQATAAITELRAAAGLDEATPSVDGATETTPTPEPSPEIDPATGLPVA